MAKFKSNGYEFEYYDEGSGEPLVLVHGSASDYRTWEYQRPELKKKLRVITYSRRYHWPNKGIPEGTEYTMNEQVNDLENLLVSLQVTPAHLIGHSYGGFLCLLLAMRKPEYVSSLILGEPPVLTLFVSNNPKPLEIFKVLITSPSTAFSIMKFGAKGIDPATKAFKNNKMEDGMRIFGEATLGKEGYMNMPDKRKEQTFDNQQNAKAEILGPGFLPLKENELRQVEIPTLLLSGENSINLFRHFTNRLNELLSNAELAVIPNARHLMQEDNPEVFNNSVIRFIEKISNG